MKKIKIITGLLCILALALEITNVFLSNTLSADSITAGQLQAKIKNLEQKNLILHSELLENTSYEQIASRAADLGFGESKHTISLNRPPKVALGQ